MSIVYHNLANAVLLVHILFVAFVIFGLVFTLWGGYRHWAWIKNTWFRTIHLACIGVVVAQAWAGIICPLTTLEMWLREKAGEANYAGGFIQYWLQRILFFDAPLWVFTLVYSLIAVLVFTQKTNWVRQPFEEPMRRIRKNSPYLSTLSATA